jgi:hypothetical protein
MVGSVLPLADAVTGGAWVLHTLAGSAAVLVAVIVATRRRRLDRRRWLGIPIGMLVHLVLDGTWADGDLFWWPVTGTTFTADVPELSRPALGVVLELAGVAALAWCWRRFGLADPSRRRHFVQTGHLDRALAGPER